MKIFTILVYIIFITGCAATIFKFGSADKLVANELATIIIPSSVILERINKEQFGLCSENKFKKCAIQLIPGKYIFSVVPVKLKQSIYTKGGSVSTHNWQVEKSAIVVSITLRGNTFYEVKTVTEGVIKIVAFNQDDPIRNDYNDANYKTVR